MKRTLLGIVFLFCCFVGMSQVNVKFICAKDSLPNYDVKLVLNSNVYLNIGDSVEVNKIQFYSLIINGVQQNQVNIPELYHTENWRCVNFRLIVFFKKSYYVQHILSSRDAYSSVRLDRSIPKSKRWKKSNFLIVGSSYYKCD